MLDCKHDIVNRGNSATFVIIDNDGNGTRCGIADLGGKTGLKAVFDHNFKQITGFIYDEWLNEAPYFIGVKSSGNDVFDARSWQKLDAIPQEYWNHRFKEKEG